MTKRKRGETKLGKFAKGMAVNWEGGDVKPTPKNEGDKGEKCPTCGVVVYPSKCNDPMKCPYKKREDNMVWTKLLSFAGISLIYWFL